MCKTADPSLGRRAQLRVQPAGRVRAPFIQDHVPHPSERGTLDCRRSRSERHRRGEHGVPKVGSVPTQYGVGVPESWGSGGRSWSGGPPRGRALWPRSGSRTRRSPDGCGGAAARARPQRGRSPRRSGPRPGRRRTPPTRRGRPMGSRNSIRHLTSAAAVRSATMPRPDPLTPLSPPQRPSTC